MVEGFTILVNQHHGELARALAEPVQLQTGRALFETGDERYAWLNSVVAVAEGRVLPNAVEYRVYACAND